LYRNTSTSGGTPGLPQICSLSAARRRSATSSGDCCAGSGRAPQGWWASPATTVFSWRFATNEAPPADAQERFRIPLPDLKAAYALNRRDLAVFFEYASAFAKRVRDAGYRTTPPENANWSCRIEENAHLVGWLAREPTDCYFLVIRVNGEARAIVALDRQRNDVHRKGLTAHPVCGFSYPLAMAGAGPGDALGVEVMGAPAFSRTLSV
jgi:hypothetical protein